MTQEAEAEAEAEAEGKIWGGSRSGREGKTLRFHITDNWKQWFFKLIILNYNLLHCLSNKKSNLKVKNKTGGGGQWNLEKFQSFFSKSSLRVYFLAIWTFSIIRRLFPEQEHKADSHNVREPLSKLTDEQYRLAGREELLEYDFMQLQGLQTHRDRQGGWGSARSCRGWRVANSLSAPQPCSTFRGSWREQA